MLNFESISKLKFQDHIKINKKILCRAQEYPDWNTLDNSVEYLFYETWDKKKNILPKPNYLVKLYTKIKSEKKQDGWVSNRIKGYENGEITNLETKKKEVIKSIE